MDLMNMDIENTIINHMTKEFLVKKSRYSDVADRNSYIRYGITAKGKEAFIRVTFRNEDTFTVRLIIEGEKENTVAFTLNAKEVTASKLQEITDASKALMV